MNSRPRNTSYSEQNILLAVNNLPAMPQVVRKARTLIQSSASSLKDVANLLETDQALAIRVLRMANSVYYSRMGRVSSVQEAAVVLGLKTVGELITVAFTSRLLGSSLKGYGLPARSLWKHSLAAAVGSRMIANLKFAALANEAFLAGLVHDAGKLILDPYILERKEEFSEYLTDDEQTFLSAEKKLFGFDHAEIAAKVCQKWNFPRSTSIAIEYHHDPSRSLGNKLTYVIHVADQIAQCSYTDSEGRTCEFDDDSIQILGIEKNDVELIVAKLARCVDNIVEAVESEGK